MIVTTQKNLTKQTLEHLSTFHNFFLLALSHFLPIANHAISCLYRMNKDKAKELHF